MSFPKGQHIIPRFLLENFSFPNAAGNPSIHVFRRGGASHQQVVRDAAKQRYFYARPNEENTEAHLSQLESGFSHLVRSIRNEGVENQDAEKMIDFVVHLAFRSKHLRSGVAELIETTLDRFFDLASAPAIIAAAIKADPTGTEERLRAVAQDTISDPAEREVFVRRSLGGLTEGSLNIYNEVAEILAQARGLLDLTPSIRTGHNQALLSTGEATGWHQRARTWTWALLRGRPGSCIIGDVGPIAFTSPDGAMMALLAAKAYVGVAVPASHHELLVALDPELSSMPFSFEHFAYATASLSRHFFCAFQRTDFEDDLTNHIGEQAHLLTVPAADELKTAILDALTQAKGTSPVAEDDNGA